MVVVKSLVADIGTLEMAHQAWVVGSVVMGF